MQTRTSRRWPPRPPQRNPVRELEAPASVSLRPFLLAALAEAEPGLSGRPVLCVAADDRGARDLAGELGAYLAPRRVRYYPSRGTGYESHLAPPPHLVGLRIAALDALVGAAGGRAADRGRERGRPRRGGPRRVAAPGRLRAREGGGGRPRPTSPSCSSAAATNGSSRSTIAASSRCGAASSTSSARPRTRRPGSSCSGTRSSRSASSRPSPSARSRRPTGSSSTRRPRSTPITGCSPRRRSPTPTRTGRSGRWPSSCRPIGSARCWS